MTLTRVVTWLCVAACSAEGIHASAAQPVDLSPGTILAALRTSRMEDGGFTSFAVNLSPWVPALPQSISICFDWARGRERRPFQYFKKALLTRVPQLQRELNAAAALDAAKIKDDLGLKASATESRAFVDTTVRLAKDGRLAPTMVADAHASAKSSFWKKFDNFHGTVVAAAREHSIAVE
jgi:hypothetical protein